MPGTTADLSWVRADGPRRIDAARELLREYAASLSIDLCFQGFEAELAALPGVYAPPQGRLLLVFVGDALAGSGGLRALAHADHPDACEMKRLYVRPGFRGRGLGRALAERLLDEARAIGYRAMLLDTLDSMHPARALYASLGFKQLAPYYPNPITTTCYMKAVLGPAASSRDV